MYNTIIGSKKLLFHDTISYHLPPCYHLRFRTFAAHAIEMKDFFYLDDSRLVNIEKLKQR